MLNDNRPFYQIGGTLRHDSPSYVVRGVDAALLDALRAGAYCYVLNSRQTGKSSLMIQTALRLREEGLAVALVDLTAIGQHLSIEQWYDGLIRRVAEQLDMEDEAEDYCRGILQGGAMRRWTDFLRHCVLKEWDAPVVIFIDEIDCVRSLPFSVDEFFAGIREL